MPFNAKTLDYLFDNQALVVFRDPSVFRAFKKKYPCSNPFEPNHCTDFSLNQRQKP